MSIEDERRYSSQGMAEESASIIVKQQQEIESLRSELSDAKQEASTLAVALHRRHYKEESPQWELLDTVPSIISQINNMTAGMSETIETLRSELAARDTSRAATPLKTAALIDEIIAERDELERRLMLVRDWSIANTLLGGFTFWGRFLAANTEAAEWFEEE